MTIGLDWTGGDPDGDAVTYDVYFGTANPPTAKVSGNLNNSFYNPGALSANTTYYWKVITLDENDAAASSPVWHFTTSSAIIPGEMVFIPAGTFQMGCDPAHNAGGSCYYSELPLHTVYLDAYNIDKYEVTNAQYAQCMVAGGCITKCNGSYSRTSYYDNSFYQNYPCLIGNVRQGEAYCAWAGKRLPTEAEWEKAARGAEIIRAYPWGDQDATCSLANFSDSSGRCVGDTSVIGSYPAGASIYGVMDMAGNVQEWVHDLFSDTYYSDPSANYNPQGPTTITEWWSHVLRGGHWAGGKGRLRTASRVGYKGAPEDYLPMYSGFRCAANVDFTNTPPITPFISSPADGTLNKSLTTQLSWTGNDPDGDAVTYDVYFGTTNPPVATLTRAQNTATYDPGILEEGTAYYWKVVTWDEHGAGTTGPVWSFTTTNAPDIPANPFPIDGTTNIGLTISLSWAGGDPDGDDVLYDVYFGTANPPTVKFSDDQSGTIYSPGTLAVGTTYYWTVTARDEQNTVTSGPVWSFTTGSGAIVPGEMVSIPAGTFQMGCHPEHNGGNDCPNDELPLHAVFLDAYNIDRYEVTNAQYAQCVAAGICSTRSNASYTRTSYYDNPLYQNYPLLTEYWSDAEAYCTWAGKRLPTEAEWEKAARGANNIRAYPWGDQEPTCSLANYGSCVGDTSAIGSYPTGGSIYGVMDMAGNVQEWVHDYYSGSYYTDPSAYNNPQGPSSSAMWSHVARGGSWQGSKDEVSISRRYAYYFIFIPSPLHTNAGFRCASDPDSANQPPNTPASPSPAEGAINQTLNVPLRWIGADPEGDSVTYDVYFGTDNPPATKVSSGQSATTYAPGTLATGTTYYWNVIAQDKHGSTTTGPVWSFTTLVTTNMVSIPAGGFQMGCDINHNGDSGCYSDELPLRTVNLDSYLMDIHEVTNTQYAQCVTAGSCTAPESNSSYTHTSYYDNTVYAGYPVIHVNWDQAKSYCEWAGKRLPTEAEWEKAARGSSDTRAYPWGDQAPSCTLANYMPGSSACVGDTSEVESYLSGISPFNVLNLAGNVWEWVNDWYSATYYANSSSTNNPQGPAEGSYRVLRGGSWAHAGGNLRVADRDYNSPTNRSILIGFRCAVSLP